VDGRQSTPRRLVRYQLQMRVERPSLLHNHGAVVLFPHGGERIGNVCWLCTYLQNVKPKS